MRHVRVAILGYKKNFIKVNCLFGGGDKTEGVNSLMY